MRDLSAEDVLNAPELTIKLPKSVSKINELKSLFDLKSAKKRMEKESDCEMYSYSKNWSWQTSSITVFDEEGTSSEMEVKEDLVLESMDYLALGVKYAEFCKSLKIPADVTYENPIANEKIKWEIREMEPGQWMIHRVVFMTDEIKTDFLKEIAECESMSLWKEYQEELKKRLNDEANHPFSSEAQKINNLLDTKESEDVDRVKFLSQYYIWSNSFWSNVKDFMECLKKDQKGWIEELVQDHRFMSKLDIVVDHFLKADGLNDQEKEGLERIIPYVWKKMKTTSKLSKKQVQSVVNMFQRFESLIDINNDDLKELLSKPIILDGSDQEISQLEQVWLTWCLKTNQSQQELLSPVKSLRL